MVAKEVIAWVHYQLVHGQAETAIREQLLARGYSQDATQDALVQAKKYGTTFHNVLNAHGTIFQIVSYVIIITFLLGALTTIVAAFMYNQFIVGGLGLAAIAVLYMYVRQNNVYNSLRLSFLLSPITFLFFLVVSSPALYGIFSSPLWLGYILVPLVALVVGGLGAMLFYLMQTTQKEFRSAAVIFSTMTAIICSFNTAATLYLRTIAERASQLPLDETTALLTRLGENTLSPFFFVPVSLIGFTLPFIWMLWKTYHVEKKVYYWFSVPLAAYLLFTLLISLVLQAL